MLSAPKSQIVECVLSSQTERPNVIDLKMNGRSASDAVLAYVCTAPIVAGEYRVAYTCRDMARPVV